MDGPRVRVREPKSQKASAIRAAPRPHHPGHAMSYMVGLKCRECARVYPKEVINVCEYCFGSIEVDYDYDAIRRSLTRASFASMPESLWRYRELLPIEGEPTVGL